MSKIEKGSSLVRKLFRNIAKSADVTVPKPNFYNVWWNRPKNKPNSDFLNGQQQMVDNLIRPKLNELLGSTGYTVNNYKTFDGINTWHFSTQSPQEATTTSPPLVLIHGYLASSMCYYKNIPELLARFPNIYLLDLPGHGATTYSTKTLELKITKPLPIAPKIDISHSVTKAADFGAIPAKKGVFEYQYLMDHPKYQHIIKQSLSTFYVDMLEQWKIDSKLSHTKLNLVGHSYGGYISSQYWLKYGEKSVNKMALLSPLGMERNLFSINNKDIYSNQKYDIDFHDPLSSKYCRPTKVPKFLFDNQFNFFSKIGPVGAWLLWGYCTRRYVKEDTLFKTTLYDQMYNMNDAEQNFNLETFKTLFSPYLTAYDPVLDYYKYINDQQDKFLCVFGEHDWMNSKSGEYFQNFKINSKSGHNLMLDNPAELNNHLANFFL